MVAKRDYFALIKTIWQETKRIKYLLHVFHSNFTCVTKRDGSIPFLTNVWLV